MAPPVCTCVCVGVCVYSTRRREWYFCYSPGVRLLVPCLHDIVLSPVFLTWVSMPMPEKGYRHHIYVGTSSLSFFYFPAARKISEQKCCSRLGKGNLERVISIFQLRTPRTTVPRQRPLGTHEKDSHGFSSRQLADRFPHQMVTLGQTPRGQACLHHVGDALA